MATKTYQGSCHCGRIKFEADIDLAQGTSKCNCTFCWKKRLWSTKVAPENFRAGPGAEFLSEYKPGQERGHRGFCKQCGVMTYNWVPVSDWNPTEYVSVAVSSLDNLDPADLKDGPVTYCDGKANNWWNPPAETSHL